MVLFDNVSKKYGRQMVALTEVNLKIIEREFVFIVGSSGAGKTSLLRCINREIIPSSGSVYVDDWEVNKLSSHQLPYLRRKVGYIFQDFKLLMDRTVAENIAVSLEILGIPQKVMEKKVEQVLTIVHLENKEDYFPKQLSYGEQQRVAIGRAIVGETKILLADEPTGNLDPKTSWEILKILNNINKQGTCIIMATHNMDIVNSMKKRVIVISNGKIIKDEKASKYSLDN